jgi:hypothetical protein
VLLSGSGVVARVRLLIGSGVVVREECGCCQGGVVLLSGSGGVVVREEWYCCQVRRESASYCSRFFKHSSSRRRPYLCMFRQLRQAMHDPLSLRVNVKRGHQFTQMQRRVLDLHRPPPAFHVGPYLNINHIEKKVSIDSYPSLY